jgi:hypothetical protein
MSERRCDVVIEVARRSFHEGSGVLLSLGNRKGMESPKTAARLMTPATTLSWWVAQSLGRIHVRGPPSSPLVNASTSCRAVSMRNGL